MMGQGQATRVSPGMLAGRHTWRSAPAVQWCGLSWGQKKAKATRPPHWQGQPPSCKVSRKQPEMEGWVLGHLFG